MELECSTPINNRSVGADFYICNELEKDSIIEEIEKRENNFNIEEINSIEFCHERQRIQKRNFTLMTGY
jgi:hypothetical protein